MMKKLLIGLLVGCVVGIAGAVDFASEEILYVVFDLTKARGEAGSVTPLTERDLTGGSTAREGVGPYGAWKRRYWDAGADTVAWLGVNADEYKTTKLVLRHIPAQTFTMGSPATEPGRLPDERFNASAAQIKTYGYEDPHVVTLTDFYLGVFELTQKQWELCGDAARANAWGTEGDRLPANRITVAEIRGTVEATNAVTATSFMGRLASKVGDGWSFDLPTEAQWEAASRAGTATGLYDGTELPAELTYYTLDGRAKMKEITYEPLAALAVFFNGGDRAVTTVGTKLPNNYGLYDMLGNAGEICRDRIVANDGYGVKPLVDPLSVAGATCLRGGSSDNWHTYNYGLAPFRAAARAALAKAAGATQRQFGFRIAARGVARALGTETAAARYAVGVEPGSVMLSIFAGPDTRGFAWHTSADVTQGAVVLLEGDCGAADAARFASEGRVIPAKTTRADDPALSRHTAVADGLKAGGVYSYRLGCEGHWAYGRFTVGTPDDGVTIVNLNDAQTKDARKFPMWENSCRAAAAVAGGADAIDFILEGGDFYDSNLYNAGPNTATAKLRYLQWGMAADSATPHFPGVPWVHASGNHDYFTYKADSNVVAENFAVTNGGYVGCHSFDFGAVHVATLPWVDYAWREDRHGRVLDWLRDDLAATRARGTAQWTVVMTHAGPYTTGDNMRGKDGAESVCASNLVRRLGAICAAGEVDLVLQAHDHTYSKTRPYRWDGPGFTFTDDDAAAVVTAPTTRKIEGVVCDVNPRGTYYVSAGCAGHRVGELKDFAAADGAKSYRRRHLKVATGAVNVDSRLARAGDDASDDTGRSMFGVLRIDGSRLVYSFYTVERDGSANLYDAFGIVKE